MTKLSLFSQSLFALPLERAIEATVRVGFPAIELACAAPHFDLERATQSPREVAGAIRDAGLAVSALSLFNDFTTADAVDEELRKAETYLRLAPLFGTAVAKLTPGPPGSAQASEEHWGSLSRALERLAPLAQELQITLAFETHMRQLTDTFAGARRLLALAPSGVVGLTVDFSNLSFAGERMADVFETLGDHTHNTHLKNGTVGEDGSWRFHALDTGWTDYSDVIHRLHQMGYDGYLTIECLGRDAQQEPVETAARDLALLKRYLAEEGWDEP